jgi:hypothetical protein
LPSLAGGKGFFACLYWKVAKLELVKFWSVYSVLHHSNQIISMII